MTAPPSTPMRFGFRTCRAPDLTRCNVLTRAEKSELARRFVEYTVLQGEQLRTYRQHGSGRRAYWTTFARRAKEPA